MLFEDWDLLLIVVSYVFAKKNKKFFACVCVCVCVCVCLHDNTKSNRSRNMNLNTFLYTKISQTSWSLSDQSQGHSGTLKCFSI